MDEAQLKRVHSTSLAEAIKEEDQEDDATPLELPSALLNWHWAKYARRSSESVTHLACLATNLCSATPDTRSRSRYPPFSPSPTW